MEIAKKYRDKLYPDFTATVHPGDAKVEIYKFIEILGVKMTVEQKKILNSLLKHYGNLCRSKEVALLETANNKIYQMQIKYEGKPSGHNQHSNE